MVDKQGIPVTRPEREAAVVKAAMNWHKYADMPIFAVDGDLLEKELSNARNKLFNACAALHRQRGRKG